MKQVTVFVGGGVGSAPYHPRTWSGSSRFFLNALDRAGSLDHAVGLQLGRLQRYFYYARSFSTDRSIWRKQFYLNLGYRNAMTKAARQFQVDSPACLQYGSWFCLPGAFPGKECYSYHDGNGATSAGSGFATNGIPARLIDRSLRYEEEVSQQMTAIFTMSEFLRSSFVHDYHVPPERVFNIGAGVNLDEIPEVREKDYCAPRALFVGIEFERKGGRYLLDAFKIVRQSNPAAELHVVGPQKLEACPEGVIFHGRLSKTDPAQKALLESLFRDCNLFVMPSLYEPFGIAPLEAMLHRLPCILSDAGAFPEFMIAGVSGELVQKRSVDELADKIKLLFSDPDRLRDMGDRARRMVLSKYTWDATASRMTEVLNSAAAVSQGCA